MLIIKDNRVYMIYSMSLTGGQAAPPGPQLNALSIGDPAYAVRQQYKVVEKAATYAGVVRGFEDATLIKQIGDFSFVSPVEQPASGNPTEDVLRWLLTDQLKGGTLLPFPADPHSSVLVNGAWQVDAAKLEARLVGQVKLRAEGERMKVTTRGTAKAQVYSAKAAEVAYWDNMGASDAARKTAWLAMTVVNRQAHFAHAWSDMMIAGEADIVPALNRIRAGLQAAQAETVRLEAIEQQACRAIKNAGTAAAKQAAFNAVNWSWKL